MFHIQLHDHDFSGQPTHTIPGRDIHAALEIRKDYSDWAKAQIASLELIENVDYIRSPEMGSNQSRGGQNRIEYHFTLDMAKHISLASRTPKGKAYRQALIDLEKRVSPHAIIQASPEERALKIVNDWKALAEALSSPIHLALVEAAKRTEEIGVNIVPLLKSSEYMVTDDESDYWLEPTELGKRRNKTGAEINKMLAAMGLQAKISGEWQPTDSAEGLYKWHTWKSEHSTKSGRNLKWHVARIEQLMDGFFEARNYGERVDE